MFQFCWFILDDEMKKQLLYSFAIIVASCANPVIPTGGPKDEQAPKIISTSIPNKSINIKPNKITFVFDENIQVTNPSNDIVFSPFYKGRKEIKVFKKSITLELDTNYLLPNTTYSIALNQSISDLNEGNKTNYPNFLFTTGNVLDTTTIIAAYSPLNNITPKKIRAFCVDSSTNEPLYIGSVHDNNIIFSGLNSLRKKVFLFDDLNGNDSSDEGEIRGFAYNNQKDTTPVQLYPTAKISLTVQSIVNGTYKIFGFNHTYQNFYIQPLLSPLDYIFNDTIYCQLTTKENILKQIDTLLYIIPSKTDKSSVYGKKRFFLSSISLDSNNHLLYESSQPLDSIKFNNKLTDIKSIRISPNKHRLYLKDTTNITIRSSNSDSFNFRPQLYNQVNFINNDNETILVIAKNSSTAEKISLRLTPKTNHTLYLLKGEYELFYFKDSNNDYHLTPPNIIFTFPGEPFKNRKLKINGNIDFHVKLDF